MATALESKHTNTFTELLNKANASLAVSTYQAGKLILLRSQGESLNTHFVSLQKPMGVAFNQGRLSVGSGTRVIDYFNLPSVAPKVEPFNTHDGALLPRQTHFTGDIDIHEMAFDNTEELWIVNTKMSCLCTIDLKHSIVPRWRPPFISGYDLTDRCHLNGLAMRDGKPRYVSALGTTDKPGGWRENKAFGGMIMDIDRNEIISEGLSMPHSPRWYRDKLWVLESGAGQLITVDESTGEKTVIAEVPGFCRGFDFIERYALIGLSEVRETAVFAGLPLTEREQDRKCGVWIVDIESGKTEGFLVFSGGVQEIFSVQVLPWKYPALLDLNSPLLNTSYCVPEAVLKDFTPPDPTQIKLETAFRHHRSRNFDQAIETYNEVLLDDPNNITALYQMGNLLSETEKLDDAISYLEKVVTQQPNHAEAHNARGNAYASKLDYDNAAKAYRDAISADHKYALAQFNLGCILLKIGQYQKGWEGFEWRWKVPGSQPFNCPQPQWQGEDISDQTLLINCEQGCGDAIQFARFLPIVRKHCKKLIIVCLEPLRLIFKEMDCVDEVRLPSNLSGDLFDTFLPIMSLPNVLKITLENLPSDTPYLSVSKELVVPKLLDNKKPRIALVWSGSPSRAKNAVRSCPIEEIVKVTDYGDYDFYSFQTPLTSEHRKLLADNSVNDLEQELVSYSHTGALLQQMDLVISVCTSVVHLAGALNIPTVALLSTRSDWRWSLNEENSSWYPNTSILRQKTANDWAEVIPRLAIEIERRLADK